MAQAVTGGGLRRRAYDFGAAARQERAPKRTASLWRPEDLLRWGLAAGLGGIVIAVSWYVCAGDVSFSQQIGPTDAAVAGLLLAGIGNTGWLLKGRRALGERRRLLLPDVPETVATVAAAAATGHAVDTGRCVAGEGMARYHRPDCALASGRRDWVSMTADEHEAAGRQPCGVCRP